MNLYRALRAFVALIRHYTRRYEYFAHVRYRVVQQSGDRLHLQALTKGVWPDQTHLSVMPGAAGYDAHPALGSIVLVVFPEGDVKLDPVVTHFAGPGQTGFVPVSIVIGGSPGRPVARVGDQVNMFFPPAMPFVGLAIIPPAVAPIEVTGVITILDSPVGTIQTGSDKVAVGGA